MISTNPILFTTKYRYKFCKKLDIIYKNVDLIYYGNVHLQKNIIRVCKSYPALVAGLINSLKHISDLNYHFYISIVNYKAVYKSGNRVSYTKTKIINNILEISSIKKVNQILWPKL